MKSVSTLLTTEYPAPSSVPSTWEVHGTSLWKDELENDQMSHEEGEAQVQLQLSKSKAVFLNCFPLCFLILLANSCQTYCQLLHREAQSSTVAC